MGEREQGGDKEKMKHIRETRSFVTYSMSLSLLMLSCSVAIIQEGHNGTERKEGERRCWGGGRIRGMPISLSLSWGKKGKKRKETRNWAKSA